MRSWPTRLASTRQRGLHRGLRGQPGSTPRLPCRSLRLPRARECGEGGEGAAKWGRHAVARGEEGLASDWLDSALSPTSLDSGGAEKPFLPPSSAPWGPQMVPGASSAQIVTVSL